MNRGIGRDRLLIHHMAQANIEKEKGNIDVVSMLSMNQVIEQTEMTTSMIEINDTIVRMSGLNLPVADLRLKCQWDGMRLQKENIIENKNTSQTIYRIDRISDREIKECTGFPSLATMVAYIVVLNNGNMETLIETTTEMTWFEEWMLFFERVWGKSCTRWADCRRKYHISDRCCCRVYDVKRKISMQIRRSWPRFATQREDVTLRRKQWSETYGENRRLIMWDNTNVRMPKPSQAEAQRLTFSSYYGANVGKGSVFIQPCGWMGTGEIWTGGVSDSDYMIRSNILKYQEHYLPIFDSRDESIPWTNICDKGYRISTYAFTCGGQKVWQPAFARSDKKFTSEQTLRSASIAADRSGNERAVKYAKMCGYISAGLKENGSSARLCESWLILGFQVNFMFKPVH